MSGIKKGDEIVCCMCKRVIYVAAADIPSGSPLRSKFLLFADGKPVPEHSPQACPECWILFRSISTETRETIL